MPDIRDEPYSEDELRRMLYERYRVARKERIAQFRRSGKIERFAPASISDPHEPLHQEQPYGEKQHLRQDERAQLNSGLSKALKFIEFGAVIVLLIFAANGLRALKTLNQTTLETLRLPEITPTPLITPVLLPSSHTTVDYSYTPPKKDNFAHGYDRSLDSPQFNIPAPTPASEFATRIQIPTIGIDAPIVQGVESEQLKKGVGQVPGTANPGQNGNMVLSAHNDIYGELFRYLDQLKPGDQFTVFTNLSAYTYIITGTEIVEPTRIEVMAPTPDATATLISCYPYLIDNMRIIVRARLTKS